MSPTHLKGDLETVDCRSVSDAATLLGLREFDYFRLAYRRWFGEQPYPDRLERAFVDYMMRQRVPPWVRMLTWQVISADRAGTLQPVAFGAERYRDRPQRPRSGPAYIAGFAVVWMLLFGALIELDGQSTMAHHQVPCTSGAAFNGGVLFGNAAVASLTTTRCQ